MAVLNSNPEILLRKRKNNERKKLEKQEQAKQRKLDQQKRKKSASANKFIRPETLISNHKSNELENKRIKQILRFEKQQNQRISHKQELNDESKLLFIIRIPNHTKGLRIPTKAKNILQLLRLQTVNTGVFVKSTPKTQPLLRLISPYIVAGNPSLNSVRKLFQKRACIQVEDEDFEGELEEGESKPTKSIKLDNNQVIEDKFSEFGIICIEDIIHEFLVLGSNFKLLSNWLLPFKLNEPIQGWSPRAKLAKLQYENEHKRKISMAGNAPLIEIDIDQFIEEQN